MYHSSFPARLHTLRNVYNCRQAADTDQIARRMFFYLITNGYTRPTIS